jgi:hypothetical protein
MVVPSHGRWGLVVTRTDEAQRQADIAVSRDRLLESGWVLDKCGTCNGMVIIGHKVWTLSCRGVPQCSWKCLATASLGPSTGKGRRG